MPDKSNYWWKPYAKTLLKIWNWTKLVAEKPQAFIATIKWCKLIISSYISDSEAPKTIQMGINQMDTLSRITGTIPDPLAASTPVRIAHYKLLKLPNSSQCHLFKARSQDTTWNRKKEDYIWPQRLQIGEQCLIFQIYICI